MKESIDPFLDFLLRRIDERLDQLKMTRRAASLAAGLGPDFVREIDRGRQPSMIKTAQFARSIGVPLSWLIGDDLAPPAANGNTRSIKEIEAVLVQIDRDTIRPLREFIVNKDASAMAELEELQEAADSASEELRAVR